MVIAHGETVAIRSFDDEIVVRVILIESDFWLEIIYQTLNIRFVFWNILCLLRSYIFELKHLTLFALMIEPVDQLIRRLSVIRIIMIDKCNLVLIYDASKRIHIVKVTIKVIFLNHQKKVWVSAFPRIGLVKQLDWRHDFRILNLYDFRILDLYNFWW
jgi:hypothetical protein